MFYEHFEYKLGITDQQISQTKMQQTLTLPTAKNHQ